MSTRTDRRDPLLALRRGDPLSPARQMAMVLRLSLPAILAQLSTVVMQYIDAAMVGRLGAGETAAIGLVSSSTWLFGGLCGAVFSGFTVMAAQSIGAGDEKSARNLMKEAFVLGLSFALLLSLLGTAVSKALPGFLGADAAIWQDASHYFLVYVLSLPLVEINYISSAMLQASGNMRVPSLLNVLMCALDVVFNFFLIFPGRTLAGFTLPGAGLGVLGAALGTALSQAVTSLLMLWFLLRRSPMLRLRRGEKMQLVREHFRENIRIAIPVAVEESVMCGAHIVFTGIVAPLGTVELAAHSFAVTAESLCYMPGYGIATASATIIGQSIGAKRDDLTRRLGWRCTLLGVTVMGTAGALMYIAAPWMIGFLSREAQVVAMGTAMLRMVVFTEPFYAVSIVSSGVFRGAGDTLVPSLMNFVSMWLVRLPLAAWLAPKLGLRGVWIAMCVELLFRGCIFMARLALHDWENTMKKPAR